MGRHFGWRGGAEALDELGGRTGVLLLLAGDLGGSGVFCLCAVDQERREGGVSGQEAGLLKNAADNTADATCGI